MLTTKAIVLLKLKMHNRPTTEKRVKNQLFCPGFDSRVFSPRFKINAERSYFTTTQAQPATFIFRPFIDNILPFYAGK